jgi:predicted RNA-binding Zn-ribbon protein involved in translation (DUF1610 family)
MIERIKNLECPVCGGEDCDETHASDWNVIRLQERHPHLVGEAKCLSCNHEWAAVAPIGTVWLECPECGLEKGRLAGTVYRDEPHWHCNCGNELFYVTANGYYCPNCGLDQKGF